MVFLWKWIVRLAKDVILSFSNHLELFSFIAESSFVYTATIIPVVINNMNSE